VVYRTTPPSGVVLWEGLGSAVDGVATPMISALATFGLERRSADAVMVAAVLDRTCLRVDTISTLFVSSSSAVFIIMWFCV